MEFLCWGGTYWNGNPVSYFTNAFTYYPGNQSPHGMVVADGTVSTTMANTESTERPQVHEKAV